MLYESFKDIDRSLVQVGGAVPLIILSWRGSCNPPPAPPVPASLMTFADLNDFLDFWPPKIIHGHTKTNVTCSTCRKEHTGLWNFALAPSEAKLSVITDFLHFSALDLTSEVTGWPRTLSLYINLFVSPRATRSFFPRSSSSIRGETARGSLTPLVPWKDAKWPVPARVKGPYE